MDDRALASQAPNEVNNQTAFFNESKGAKEKCPINKLHKQNKYLGAERTSIKFNIRYLLLALSRRLTRWPNKVLLYLLLLSDLSGGSWNTFKKNSCCSLVRDHLSRIHIPKRKFMTPRSKVYNDKPLVLLNIFIISLYHNREPVHRLSWQRSCIRIEKTSTPLLPCSKKQAIIVSKLYTCRNPFLCGNVFMSAKDITWLLNSVRSS